MGAGKLTAEILINSTSTIGNILKYMTSDVTGNVYLTLFIIFIVALLMCMLFSIPMEFSAIILLPLSLVCSIAVGNFVLILVVSIIYISMFLARVFIFK